MIEVSQEEFFASVGSLDVHPYPQSPWSDEWGYVVYWKLRNGSTIGISRGRFKQTYKADPKYLKSKAVA